MRLSRIIRDDSTVVKLRNWFAHHHPFPETDKIMSINSGVVGCEAINGRIAQQVGIQGISRIVCSNFGNVRFKRKDKVLTLASVTNAIKKANKII